MANNEINQVVVNGNTYTLAAQDVNLATVETDASSASKSYAIGDHLVVDNDYCKVIAAISAGDALVKGSNIQNAKVGDEINQLNTSFSNALTSLKNTAIAQAVGATGSTFTSVIAKLAKIVNRGAWRANMANTGSVTIPAGYHNGTGTVKTSGTATITTNGTHNIAQYTSVNVNVVTTNKVFKVYATDWVTPDGNTLFYRPKMVLTDGTTVSAVYDDNGAWNGHASTNIFYGFFNYVRQQQNVAVITPLITDVYRLSGSSISRIPKGTAISIDCRDTQFMLIY